MINKSVISLISYDCDMLVKSIARYYEYVDEIVLGLDQDRISWSKNEFKFDESKLWKELNAMDGDNKISVIEENFHQSSIAIENDNFERNYLKSQCTHDWVFSFDADEQLVNPKHFFYQFIPKVERYYNTIDLMFTWFMPYKRLTQIIDNPAYNVPEGTPVDENEPLKIEQDVLLMIANEDNSFLRETPQGFVTHKDFTYRFARWTNNQKTILSPLAVIHWSLCRPEKELEQKIKNIGHSDLVEKDPFFDTWKQITLENFEQLRNFKSSGFGNNQWPKLIKIPEELLTHIAEDQCKLVF
jgi:hypothetical protein